MKLKLTLTALALGGLLQFSAANATYMHSNYGYYGYYDFYSFYNHRAYDHYYKYFSHYGWNKYHYGKKNKCYYKKCYKKEVHEPATLALLGIGLIGLMAARRARRRS